MSKTLGRENKHTRILAFILAVLSLSSLVGFFQETQAMETRKNAAGLVDGLNYQKSDCESVGLSYDPEGSGSFGYGCVFTQRNLQKIENNIYTKPTNGNLIESSPARVVSQVSNYLTKDGAQCLIGYTSKKIKVRTYKTTGSNVVVQGSYDPGKTEIVDTDGVLCIKSDSNAPFAGYPPSYKGKEEMTKGKCESFGMKWEKGVGDKYWCTYLNTKESKAVRVVASAPDEYLIEKGKKCPAGWKQSKYTQKRSQTQYSGAGQANGTTTVKTEMVHCVKEGINPVLGTQTGEPGSGAEEKPGDGKTSCAVENVGWIVCPGANFMTQLAVSAYDMIDGFLQIDSARIFNTEEDGNKAAYEAWKTFRDIANVIFVIIFLAVIFSQITGVGISNYGIKKTLPRLIMFAILINISFWLTVIIIDLSNIIGAGIYKFLLDLSAGQWKAQGQLVGNVQSILAGNVAAGVAVVFAAGAVLMAAVSAAIGVIVMFAALSIRQAIVILLVATSPIAFAAAILPNTEGIFKKWKDILKVMLILYPTASLIVGFSVVASNILYATNEGNSFMGVVYGLVPLLSLATVASLTKGLLATIDKISGGSIGAKINSMAAGAQNRAEKSSLTQRARNFSRGNRDAFSGKTTGTGRFSRGLNRLGRVTGAGTVGSMARDSATKARIGQNANEYNDKLDKRDRELAILNELGEQGKLTAPQQRYRTNLNSEMLKEEEALSKARAMEITKGYNLSDDIAAAEILKGAVASGDMSTMNDHIKAIWNNTSMTKGAKLKALNSAFSGQEVTSEIQEAFKRNSDIAKEIRNSDVALSKYMTNAAAGSTQTLSEVKQDDQTYAGLDGKTLIQQSDFSQIEAAAVNDISLQKEISEAAAAALADPELRAENAKNIGKMEQLVASDSAVSALTKDQATAIQNQYKEDVKNGVKKELAAQSRENAANNQARTNINTQQSQRSDALQRAGISTDSNEYKLEMAKYESQKTQRGL